MVRHFSTIISAEHPTGPQFDADPVALMARADKLIPGKAPAIVAMKQMMVLLLNAQAPVLVHGPSGAGKELVAQALHDMSRRTGDMVAVNCAAIPADLLEGELFGAERGAYTGADSARAGLIEQAQGGTLFLDEIGDLPLQMQAKLLRVLETRSMRRLGGRSMIDLDIAVVAATHRDLAAMVKDGTFREDLYFRLSVFPLSVPPLTERLSDLPMLLDHLMHAEAKGRHDISQPVFEASALRVLSAHDWPGNIRELKTLVQRACLLFPGRKVGAREVNESLMRFSYPEPGQTDWPAAPLPDMVAQDAPNALGEVFRHGSGKIDLRGYLRDIEVVMISAALDAQSNCVSRAADVLGLRRTTLIEKMRKHGLAR